MMMRVRTLTGLGILLPLLSCQSGGNTGGLALLGGKPTEDWTILCREFTGPYHHNHCETFAQTLKRTPDIRPADVSCEYDSVNQVSRLYYGTYRREIDPKTQRRSHPPKLVNDLRLIQELTDREGRRYFIQAQMIAATVPYAGSPEWALVNTQGVYSLQVAIFYPERGFKNVRRSAVKYVKELRKEGYEAYYHHDAATSMVTVGSFGNSAVIETGRGTRRYSAEVETLRNKRQFKYNYENGQIRTKIVNGRRLEPFSFLVRIPHQRREEASR